MDEAQMFEALVDWNLWGNFKENLKDREALNFIPRPRKGVVRVIKGVRRCGKSRLAYLLSAKHARDSLIINFEDPRLNNLEAKDIIRVVEVYQKKVNENLPKFLVLDEVQNIKGWEKIARLYSEAKKVEVVVTGSSSKLMSEEYASVLTGRHVDFELFPLSFREVLDWENIRMMELEIYKNKIKVMRFFDGFIKFGGFPAVFLIENEREKIELLRNYFFDIVIKDIVKRFNVKEIEKIERLAKLYVSGISTLQSFNKLKNVVNLSLDSVERFSKYFQIARLFFFIPKFGFSVKQQVLSIKKVYCIDSGFFNAMGFAFSQNMGKLMENIVGVELLRRKSYQNYSWEIYYFKDHQQHEVDFVVKEGLNVKQLIQVTYASARDEVEQREIKALIKASELLKCKNLLIITWDYEDEEEIKGRKVKFLPLWRWLLKNCF